MSCFDKVVKWQRPGKRAWVCYDVMMLSRWQSPETGIGCHDMIKLSKWRSPGRQRSMCLAAEEMIPIIKRRYFFELYFSDALFSKSSLPISSAFLSINA